MRNIAISKRYAKALLLLSKDDTNFDNYNNEFNDFTTLMQKEGFLFNSILNPLYTKEDRKAVLRKVLEKLSLSVLIKSFLLILFDKGRFKFLKDINDVYKNSVDEIKGIKLVSLFSAKELSSDVTEKIKNVLSERSKKNIILDLNVDPSLIGGIVTKIDDLIIDGSVKTQLINMKESFKKGERV